MQIFSGGMRSIQMASTYSQAADLAETVLALAGTEWPVDGGGKSGTNGGYEWALNATPYEFSDLIAPPTNIDIYQITAVVAWTDIGGFHQIAISSLRLATKPP